MLLYLISFLSVSRFLVYLNSISSSSSLCLWSQCLYLCEALFLSFSSSFRFSCLALTKVLALVCFLCRAIVSDCTSALPLWVSSLPSILCYRNCLFPVYIIVSLVESTCQHLHMFIYSTWLLNLIVIMSTVRNT